MSETKPRNAHLKPRIAEFDPAEVRSVSIAVFLAQLEPPLETEAQWDDLMQTLKAGGRQHRNWKPRSLVEASKVYDPLTRAYLRAVRGVSTGEIRQDAA